MYYRCNFVDKPVVVADISEVLPDDSSLHLSAFVADAETADSLDTSPAAVVNILGTTNTYFSNKKIK